jgi:hypothetical protein
MKRLVGLFLAVCCLALVQVQPVAPLAKAKADACCAGECACDHDCGPANCPLPNSAPMRVPLGRTAQVVIEVNKPADPAPETSRPKPTLPPIAFILVSQRPEAARSLPTPQVPLFTRHCAFLI